MRRYVLRDISMREARSTLGWSCSAFDLLRHRNVAIEELTAVIPELSSVHPHILSRVETDGSSACPTACFPYLTSVNAAIYTSHMRRQAADLRVFMEDESLSLDPQLDYGSVEGISSEVRERLAKVRPTSIVSASSTSVSLG